MEGCDDPLRPYPPPRETPLNRAMSDLDPILGFDNSDYGHLGYDSAFGPPDPDRPVQGQYTGTWEFFAPPDDDSRVGRMLARHVLNAAANPMIYITNEAKIEDIAVGESVTFEAHVIGGVPVYLYEWSIRQEGAAEWLSVGGNSSLWTWNPASGEEGTYVIRCRVTDEKTRTGEVTWNGFKISSS